jgi:hypothetical protein
VPAASALVAHVAERVLPLPLTVAAAQPLMVDPPSLKATVPVGELPVTVAVKVTLLLATDGFAELATVLVVGAGALPVPTVTVTPLAFADNTVKLTP